MYDDGVCLFQGRERLEKEGGRGVVRDKLPLAVWKKRRRERNGGDKQVEDDNRDIWSYWYCVLRGIHSWFNFACVHSIRGFPLSRHCRHGNLGPTHWKLRRVPDMIECGAAYLMYMFLCIYPARWSI